MQPTCVCYNKLAITDWAFILQPAYVCYSKFAIIDWTFIMRPVCVFNYKLAIIDWAFVMRPAYMCDDLQLNCESVYLLVCDFVFSLNAVMIIMILNIINFICFDLYASTMRGRAKVPD